MKWPRGKYNGQRIGGFVVKFRFDLLWWGLRLPDRYGSCLSFGPIHIWFNAAYE
jgi:hypothetical protein